MVAGAWCSIRLMIGRRVAGLAAIVSEMDSALIQELSSQRIPVVFYDVGTPRWNITNIRVNYRGAMEKLIVRDSTDHPSLDEHDEGAYAPVADEPGAGRPAAPARLVAIA